jgi:hypothetical protein
MTEGAWHESPACPPTVPVHYDGDMPGHVAAVSNRLERIVHAIPHGRESPSDFHDLVLFRLHERVDLRDILVVDLLQILLGVLDVVF